jgi:hypothetical protein
VQATKSIRNGAWIQLLKRSRLLRAFDVLGVVIALSVVAAWMYGMQVRNWYRATTMRKAMPAVSLVPRPLPESAAASDKGMTLTAFGYQFEVPWPVLERHEETAGLAIYRFSGGIAVRLLNPDQPHGILDLMKRAAARSNSAATNFLGATSSFELIDAELQATPEQIRPFMKKSDSARESLLLNMKWLDMESIPTAIYSFSMKNVRGFQLGDPAGNRFVEVKSFDSSDRELNFFFTVDRRSNVRLQQGEINRVLQTLRLDSPAADGANPGS